MDTNKNSDSNVTWEERNRFHDSSLEPTFKKLDNWGIFPDRPYRPEPLKPFPRVYPEMSVEEIERVNKHFENLLKIQRQPDYASKRWKVVIKEDSSITLSIDVPGCDPKNVSANIEGDKLTVIAKRTDEEMAMVYSYNLSSWYDNLTGYAELKNGVLSMTFQKLAKFKLISLKIHHV